MPAGCEQQAGAQYAAREVSVDTSAGRLSMELSACYDCPELERYGRVIEHGLTDQIMQDPQHAYTQELVYSLL